MISYGLYRYFFPQEKSFRFRNLPKTMQNSVVSNLSFREFACLSATCREFKNILKLDDHNHQISCYLKSMLREVKVLDGTDVERFCRLNKISDISFLFRKCLNLYSVKFTLKEYIDLMAKSNEIVKSCPSLQEFKVNGVRVLFNKEQKKFERVV